jgi:hypothetical protein
MKSGRDTARVLVARAEEDLALAKACLDYSLPVGPGCFHVQHSLLPPEALP